MTDRELMQQALEALESLKTYAETTEPGLNVGVPAITALRERLAQPEQEPVSGVVLDEHGSAALVNNGAEEWHCKKHKARRLYTTPPQRKPLTDEELQAIADKCPHPRDFARAIEAAHGIKGEA